jgi:hypothetical protein
VRRELCTEIADLKPIISCQCGAVKMTLRAIDSSSNCKASLGKIYVPEQGRPSDRAVGQVKGGKEKKRRRKKTNTMKRE